MQYSAPSTVEEAVSLLANGNGGARVLAGGTDLLVQLRAKIRRPEHVVDVKHIEEATSVTQDDGGFRIGAAVCCQRLGEDGALKAAWPGVVEALELIGSTQIQGRATPGGNLCNGSPAADGTPALIAAGAICEIAGPGGRRDVPVEDIVTGPGQTVLADGEMLVAFRLPPRPAKAGDAYLRFIPRTEMDIAVVGAGVSVVLGADGKIAEARVGLGAVAPTPLLVADAASAIVGTSLDDAALAALDAAAQAACNPINDKRGTVEYRTKVSGVLARRAARIAFDRAGER